MRVCKGHCSSIFSWIRWDTPNCSHGDILYPAGPWSYMITPTQERSIATDFLQQCKSFSYLTYKGLSYVTIPASAETVSTDHTGILFMYSLVNSAVGTASGHLWEGQSRHPGCYSARRGKAAVSISWSMHSSSCPGGICRAVQNPPPQRAAVEIGQMLHSEARSAEKFVAYQSTEPNQSRVLLMQKLAGEFPEPPGNEWQSRLGVHTGKSLLSQSQLQGKLQFHFYIRLTS